MENQERLTKAQKRELRRQEWQKAQESQEKKEQFKKAALWVGAAAVVILAIAGLAFFVNSNPGTSAEPVNVAAISDKDITKGPKNAKVTLIEYADFQCPACASYQPIVNQLLIDYQDKILFVSRFFPLTSIHRNALISAQAAYAAHKQNSFFEMADILYDRQKDWENQNDPTPLFVDYAKELKLDVDKFKADLTSNETKNFVKEAERQALSEGMNSTPTFVLNGVKLQNPRNYEEFKKIIEDELK